MNNTEILGSSLIESLVNHVALPPRLPGKRENHIDQIEHALTNCLLDASRILRDLTNGKLSQQWDGIRNILQTCKAVNAGGKLDKTSLSAEFGKLENNDVLILHVAEQNAGLLIRRHHTGRGGIVVFEAFEASPLSEKVLAAENALQWYFPGCTVALPYAEFANGSFLENLAAFLEQASIESIKRFAAQTTKAGSLAFESRDTVDPSMITQMLMTLLEVNGNRIFPPRLRKRIRDDVCLTDGGIPWRRCPYWLVLRVSLQRHLGTLNGVEAGRAYYKFLIGLVLARLIDDALGDLSPEILAFLNAKFTRRLAKLEAERDVVPSNIRYVYEIMFATLGPIFHKTAKKARERIEVVWNSFKQTIRRPIPSLPRFADQMHLVLSLPNSEPYLRQVLSEWRQSVHKEPKSIATHHLSIGFDVSKATTADFRAFADRYFSLSKIEEEIKDTHVAILDSTDSFDAHCRIHAKQIGVYLTTVADAYNLCPEQKSIMLLNVMELWMLMDQCAVELFNVLLQYNPGIPPEILDVLQLLSFKDMCRLQKIQKYLRDRFAKSNFSRKTIFDDPAKGCFAERYFDESNDSQKLQSLHQSIETAAECARRRKESEWQELCSEFEELERAIAENTCLFTTDYESNVIHDDRGCTKCYLQRKARRMRILLHEHPLPTNPVQAKAVIFELGCPKAFAAYRNATWKILGTLACSKPMECFEPQVTLCDYPALEDFMDPLGPGVSLASTAKSFLSTHFKGVGFPVSLKKVCVPNGLKLAYFDSLTQSWPGRQAHMPKFAHHCSRIIPSNSPFSSLQFSPEVAADSNGPSSYQIIASQTKCPSGLNVHEFMAYQTLLSGKSRRWPTMLVELGSSNLNFSTEAVTSLMTQLILQAGPGCEFDPLGIVHRYFRDESFCMRLMEQISLRLDAVSSNWRETNCMDMLVTLILRLCLIASEPIIGQALKLLQTARTAIFKWISLLRAEIYKSTSASESERCSRYAFLAALLCRRTFAIYTEDFDAGNAENLQADALHCFIECSITLQDNMVGNPTTLPPLLRNALIRDLKMAHKMRYILRRSLEASLESLKSAINNVWPQSENDTSRFYSEPKFLALPNEWWIHSTVYATRQTKQQIIHYHLLEGHLLVDNQPLGKLPAKHRESLVLKELFGDQRLLTYPSGLHGMTYTLAFRINGHQVHFGFRDKTLIAQVCTQGKILEYVPHNVFGNTSTSFDLPGSLVHDCIHWLDLHSGVMEIRKKPDIWMSKPRNWLLDFNTRSARRVRSSLVDPHSVLFQRMARIFDRFEYRGRLTVFQPARGPLSVELRRLELSFFVNPKNCLECRELRSEIDPNQDARTWYGLSSKLVLRDTTNPRQRSIIVPIGTVGYIRNEFHVSVNVENDGSYGRFTINEVLGRLDCPAEPRLLYLKAHLHACTSFVLPDPLTGRTGTEEALHCLKSGYSQPWTLLNQGPLQSLMSIAKLAPKREYYPKNMKIMQDVLWDPNLTTTIQDDEFRPTIEAILEKISQLSVFAVKKPESPSFEPVCYSLHLLHRSYSRRRLYLRPNADLSKLKAAADLPYNARDRCEVSQARNNVFESASLLRNWPSKLHIASDLIGILQNWPTIGGFDRCFDKFLLSDRLDVQFALEWGSLVNLCRTSGRNDSYRLMFLFAVISFRNDIEMGILRTLIAFTILEGLKDLDPPQWPSYLHFRHDHIPTADYLIQLMKPYRVPYPGDERNTFQHNLGSKLRRKLEAAELAHDQQTEGECNALAQHLLAQWPCSEPAIEGYPKLLLVDAAQALDVIRPEWLRLSQNLELSQYIDQVQLVLNRHQSTRNVELPKIPIEDQEIFLTGGYNDRELPTLSQNLVRKAIPGFSSRKNPIIIKEDPRRSTVESRDNLSTLTKENFTETLQQSSYVKGKAAPFASEIQELESIIDGITNSQSTVKQRYGRDMMQSLNALKMLKSVPKHEKKPIQPAKLTVDISRAQQIMQERFNQLCVAFERDDSCHQWLKEGGLWPCITPVTLLEQLRSTSATIFGDGMKENLVGYALSIINLQHLLRIEDAYLRRNDQRILEEQISSIHSNWQPLNYPDWLLLEIDANILIRHDQVNVALATISPSSRSNSVLQMNMGQGKTSTIMPMVAAVLADTRKLLRVVVPKALLQQTAQVLQARLGGLVGREVWHVPFSRKTPTNSKIIQQFYNIHKRARASSAVIVSLPDHILSFMLSGLQRLSDNRILEATEMVKVQAWMRKVCRDVLDECDFTLAVRTQLIYPSGSQTTVDGHPHRWETVEALLHSVEAHLWNLQQEFPQSIEIVQRVQGGFPMVFFLRTDVEDALIGRLVKDISRGQIPTVPIREYTQSDRLAIKQFISDAIIRPATAERIRRMFSDIPAIKQNIYLLRGLLVHRILLLSLKKRWNVQYGLNPSRDPIAVPFHAKGVPSEQAEWGHPDVAILFTCLAFYFGGLEILQLRQSLEHVVKSDDPSSEFDRWTYCSKTLPNSLREWNIVNVDDKVQLMEIWQHLRYEVVVINYFLNHFVFPKHAKQFQMKLQASGWDVPLFSPEMQSRTGQENVQKHLKPLTTGFSGTNDNRTILPLTIKQEDLPGLSHTNAEVLTYLLQRRNRGYALAADKLRKRFSEVNLLQTLHRMQIRMLIDAGAQILEMDNLSLVKEWLKVDYEAPAAVYFNSENKAMVYYRHGSQTPLLASPFADSLDNCLVYLDEVHTRGTDLKMPFNAKGALTLGLSQTKDHTVQAAMRLRQLATSQSVVFFAPPEVDQSIRDLRRKNIGPVDSHDVVCWLLEQTCSSIEQIQPLFNSHGADFCLRTQAALDKPDFLDNAEQRAAYLGALQKPERQTLEQLYKPRLKSQSTTKPGPFSPEIAAYVKELSTRRKGFQDTGNAVHGSTLQEVEQEREVAFEVEAIREIQKPVHYSPLSFSKIHREIIDFVNTGRLAVGYGGYEQAFVALRRTSLGIKYGISSEATSSNLFVSKEFTRTVSIQFDRSNDNFLRQVSWILWSVKTETALIIIPEEAEILLPLLCEAKDPPTYLLTYAAPVTRKMLHFNTLMYFAVPALPLGWKPPTWLIIELGIFAGRLYFDFDEYSNLRKYLGYQEDDVLPSTEAQETDDTIDEVEIAPGISQGKSFTAKPLTFLLEWLAVRRKGQNFTHTPMGYVSQGKSLALNHPFFARVDNDVAAKPHTFGKSNNGGGNVILEADSDIVSEEMIDDDAYFDDEEYGSEKHHEEGEIDFLDEGNDDDDNYFVDS